MKTGEAIKMANKRRNKLYRGKFYTSYPNGGHPALIYRKNKRKNRYDAVVFGTTTGKHKTELTKPISGSVSSSVIHNRPIRGTRKDFGDKELSNLKIDPVDKPKVKIVERKIPQETRRYREQKNKKP